ncbi:hypothetical protein [Morganella morganii]|uniref:hypothetical protein n=1 Tax=Morganella morganii TaxID=582 RepID=UPI003EB66AF0
MEIKKTCVFCGVGTELTKEHIYPSGIIKSLKTSQIDLLTINDRKDTPFKGDPVIKDVCGSCNNGPLSKLDSYFVDAFNDYMSVPLEPGDDITFEYNYNLLLRELLKISYNSARAANGNYDAVTVLKRFSSYIISGYKKPSGIMLSLQIVTSANQLDTLTNRVVGSLKPYLLRNGTINGLGLNTNNYLVRMVAFNSFWFYLLMPKRNVNSKKKKEFWDEFKKKNHLHGILLKERESKIHIPKEKTTFLHPNLIEGMMKTVGNRISIISEGN